MRIKPYLIGLLTFVSAIAAASVLTDLPVKTVNGKTYHYYIVKQHETVYALSKRFGITPEQLIKFNPSAADGLKTDQELLFPADETPVNTQNNTAETPASTNGTYIVKKQETAYGISKRFNLTLEEFYQLNPDTRDGVREGQTVMVDRGAIPPKITVVPPEKLPAVVQAEVQTTTTDESKGTRDDIKGTRYVIQEHETLYQIARDNNIRLSQLLEANPGLDVARYSAGQEIIIPTESAAIPTEAVVKNTEKITIAVALPFNLDKKEKHNRNMVEFYKGILYAVDSMRNCGTPIHLITFDTESTTDGVAQIIDMSELKTANAIIAPDNLDALKTFNEYGQQNKIAIINPFNNRDSSFQTNPYAMQLAMPREEMYDRAVKAFIESFSGYIPVILVSNNGKRDKTEFTDIVKAALDKSGQPYKEIGYSGKLSQDVLAKQLKSTERYAFLPASSSKEEFDNIADALLEYKNGRNFSSDVVVWGYPEWLANRAGYGKMHNLDSYVYSRNDLPESFISADIDAAYSKWFGPEMLTAFPRRFYMGFDTGMFVLKSLVSGTGGLPQNTQYHSGLTLPIKMKRYGQNGGYYNDQLLMINLAPGEIITKRTI